MQVPPGAERVRTLGSGDRNLRMIREALGVNITARDGVVTLSGDGRGVAVARSVLERLGAGRASVADLNAPAREDVLRLITRALEEYDREGVALPPHGPQLGSDLGVFAGGREIRAKSENQQAYLDAIREHDLVFGIGPAGTGKTYLAVAAAVHMLRTEQVKRVILARPAVEAGEKLGFLPGDLQEKVNPYLRPVLDALHDMVDYAKLQRLMSSDVVEVVPLAFMRGRTLNHAAIILDEAQNTTAGQMKMFLTRMGMGSKMIVTGDVTQIDLPQPEGSGLIDAARRLRRVPGVAFVTLDKRDVVRHSMVQRIIEAYGGEEEQGAEGKG